jgi:flagellar protein FlbD
MHINTFKWNIMIILMILTAGGFIMIKVTRFNHTEFMLNCEWIETVESTPDTVITLTNGKKYVVAESVEEVVNKVIEYKRKTFFINRTINTISQNDDK